MALKQEKRGITQRKMHEFEAVYTEGVSPPYYNTQHSQISSYTTEMNPRIEQLLLPRWERTLGRSARDESRAKRGVKYG